MEQRERRAEERIGGAAEKRGWKSTSRMPKCWVGTCKQKQKTAQERERASSTSKKEQGRKHNVVRERRNVRENKCVSEVKEDTRERGRMERCVRGRKARKHGGVCEASEGAGGGERGKEGGRMRCRGRERKERKAGTESNRGVPNNRGRAQARD